MKALKPVERGPRPQLQLNRGELGLCVWGLGLLEANLDGEDGTDLLAADLARLVARLREHVYALDDWQNGPPASDDPEESPF